MTLRNFTISYDIFLGYLGYYSLEYRGIASICDNLRYPQDKVCCVGIICKPLLRMNSDSPHRRLANLI